MYRRSDDEHPLVAVVDRLSQSVLSVSAQLQAQKNELSTQILALNTRLQAQQNEIKSLKASHTPAVAFSAYISDEPRVHANQHAVVPFRGVITNVGGGYSTSTSAFTAPVLGQYFFALHADCSSDFRALLVTLNGQRVFEADNDGGSALQVTGSALMTLQKGDVVMTMFSNNAGFLDAGRESTFSGFLVK
ncbi:hypothetical protein ACOMHN_009470 [Nucella lapillus]